MNSTHRKELKRGVVEPHARCAECMRNPTIRWSGDSSELPRISIVTPCFNHAEFVEATILSILEQGYPNLEYVVMDGGSTDGSAEIIAKYADYLTYWQSCPDEGPYHAINDGFRRTTGEILAWLNSDDMLHHNALWTVAEIFVQLSQVEWLVGLRTVFDARGCTVAVRKIHRWSPYQFLVGDYTWIQQESTFWRRALWDKAGGELNTAYQYAADFELWMRFFRHAKLYTVPTLIGGFRRSPGQISEKFKERYVQEVDTILAEEPLTRVDKAILAKIKMFDRLIFRVPVLRSSRRIRKIYDRLLRCPPVIQYNQESRVFQLYEGCA